MSGYSLVTLVLCLSGQSYILHIYTNWILSCMTDQVAARESFELSPRRLLQDSWRYSIWRPWFRCKAHHADHWRPGLHGRHRDAKTVSWQGSWLKPCCILFACLMFLTMASLPMNLLPGEDNREARLLEGYPQSSDKLNDLGDGCADSDVPPSQCWTASLPFQLRDRKSVV